MIDLHSLARRLSLGLTALGLLVSPQVLAPVYASPSAAPDSAPTTDLTNSPAFQQLTQMFSPEIQGILNACADQGGVDLEVGAAPDGALTCGDGTSNSEIQYREYLSTVSDLMAASGLVGFRAVIDANPQISPAMLSAYLASSDGVGILRSAIEMGISQSQFLPSVPPESSGILVDEVVERLLPALRDPNSLTNLLGTPEQYSQVVANFCTAPGMSVEQASQITPGLGALQLYSICIQESGVADEVQQLVSP